MIVHQIYAEIFENEVKNIIVCDNYETANWLAKASYGEDAFAVDCLQYPCSIGDKYSNENFSKVSEDGAEIAIVQVSTTEDDVKELTAKIEYLSMMSGFKMEENNEKEI